MANIKDVAGLADVSVATVSNIINNKSSVSTDVYHRVIKAIEELGYRPNMLARNLKNNKTKFIGAIFPRLNHYYSQIIDGILKVTEENNYHLIVKTTNDFKNIESRIIDEFIELGVKGILLITCDSLNVNKFDSIIAAKIPMVFLERRVDDKDYSMVGFDNERTISKYTSMLFDILKNEDDNRQYAGNNENDQDVFLITGSREFASENDCIKGFNSVCIKNNKDSKERMLEVSLNKEHAFNELMTGIGKMKTYPGYFITSSDIIAESLLEVLAVLGIKNVEVYSLAGDDWCSYYKNNHLTKINRNAVACGIEGAKLLLKYIKSPLTFENRQINVRSEISDEKIYNASIRSKAAGTNINLLLVSSPTSEALIKLLPDFKNHFGINPNYEQCHYKDLYNRITNEHKKENSDFDIFMIDLPWISNFIENGYLLEIDKYIHEDSDDFADNFIPCIKDTFISFSEHIYTIPLMAGNQILFYRKDLFEDQNIKRSFYDQYGIELKPPKTWTEFNLIAKFFTRSFNSNSPTEYGTCILGLNPTGIIEEFLPRQWSYNGRMVSENGEVTVNSIENIKALKNLYESCQYSPFDSRNFLEDEQIKEFVKGDIAIISTFNLHAANIYDMQFANMINNIGFSSIPGNAPMLGGWVLGINKYSRYSEESFRFIKWACSDKLSIHNTILGGFVPKKNVSNSNELKAIYPWLENINEYLKQSRKREVIRDRKGALVNINLFEDILANELEKVIYGDCTPDKALNTVKLKFEEIISSVKLR